MNTLDNISNRAAPSSLAIDIKDCISDLSIIILESFVWYFYLAFLTKYWNQSLTLLSSLVLIALTCFYILYILYIVHESKVNLIFPLYPCSFPYPLNITYIYNFFIKMLFILFGGTNQSSAWRLNLRVVSLVLVQQSVACNLPQCCRVATCAVADAAHALQSVACCQLAMDDEETVRPRDLASSLPVQHLSLWLSPFLPPPSLRALHSFAQLMKINESKNVAYSFPLVSPPSFFRWLCLVFFSFFSFPFFPSILLCSALGAARSHLYCATQQQKLPSPQ